MTFSATVTRPSAASLVVHGNRFEGAPSLQRDGLQMPTFEPVTALASSRWVDGEVGTSSRAANGVLAMQVRIEAATAAALEVVVADWSAALRQLSYETTVVLDGTTWTFSCLPGSIAPKGPRSGLPGLDWFTIQIPVMPNPVVS